MSLSIVTHGEFMLPAKISAARNSDHVGLELAYGVIGVVLTGAGPARRCKSGTDRGHSRLAEISA